MSNEWKTVRLGDCATFINGRAFKPSEWSNIGKPIIRIQNLTGSNSDINYYEGEVDKKYKVYNGDILISWSASLGVFVWNQGDAVLNQHIFKVEFNKLSIDKKYFYYLVKNSLDAMDLQTHGATMKHITKGKFDNIQVPYFSIEQQRKIGAVLDKVSELVEKRKAQLSELDRLVESIFYDMFGDPVTNEKGWEIAPLTENAEITSSKRIFANEYTSDGIPFYRSKEIAELGSGEDISIELYIGKARYEEIKQKFDIPKEGDILIAAIGATIGKMWIVDNRQDFYFKDGNIIWIKNNGFNTCFTQRVLNKVIFDIKQQLTNGGAYPALTIVTLKSMLLINPPLALQQQFAERIEKIEEQKAKVQTALKESESLFQRLMQDMFNPEYHNL